MERSASQSPHLPSPSATTNYVPPPILEGRGATKMLSRWALLPLAAFVVAEMVTGLPRARFKASAPEYAIPFLVGQIVGILLLAFILAWPTYHAFRRSCIAG